MDPGNVAVLEKPIQEDPEELLEKRDELKKIIYTEAVLKREGQNLPQTAKELREMWDQQVYDYNEERERSKEAETAAVPEIVLKEQDEKFWSDIGWPEEKKKQVKERLGDVLKLKEPFLTHAVECLVAAGKTADQALAEITHEKYQTIYDNLPVLQEYRPTEEEKVLATKALFLEEILEGIDDEHRELIDSKQKQRYIKRFILYDEFDDRSLTLLSRHGGLGVEGYGASLKDEFTGKLPDNLFDVAWNLGYEKKDMYGIDGRFPVLRMQVHKDEDGTVKGRYVVDRANFMEWMREQIWQWYEDIDTDELTDYFNRIKIEKGSFYSINLITMLFNKKFYFSDEKGHYWADLWNQTLFEPWMMYFMRQYYLEYEKAMGSEEKLAETYNNTFFLSKFTRKLNGTSMINILSTLPVNYEGANSDTKLGEAFQTMFLIYYNMIDPDQLKEILGEDSPFFTRKFWMDTIAEVSKSDLKLTGVPKIEQYLGDKLGDFVGAFSKDGKATDNVADWKKFTTFLNYFPVPVPASTWVQIIDTGIKNVVKDNFIYKDKDGNYKDKDGNDNIKEFDLNYAWLIAHSWKYITGAAAKNNYPAVSGHNAETKWQHTREYRKKYVGYSGGGNPFTIPQFKKVSLPLLEGLQLENALEEVVLGYDEATGDPIYGKQREMIPMEVITKMRQLALKYEGQIKELKKQLDKAEGQERADLQKEIDRLEDEEKNAYKMVASKLVFKQDAMRNYAQNIIGRAKVVYEQLMGGQEIDFEKFTKYDNVLRGVSFDRAEWQKALQGSLVTPLRYLFEANGATQLNAEIRAPDENGKWKTMTIGEAMMGHEILDIPRFRMKIADVMPEKWEELKSQGYRKRGKYMIRPDGKHQINYDKVQENKRDVWKQWMLMKLAGDLHQHISLHSTDPAFDMQHIMSIIDAVENLPGDMAGDEYDMKGVRITESFFDDYQKDWFKKKAKVTKLLIFNRQFLSDLVMGDKRKSESKFGEAATIILTAIAKGY